MRDGQPDTDAIQRSIEALFLEAPAEVVEHHRDLVLAALTQQEADLAEITEHWKTETDRAERALAEAREALLNDGMIADFHTDHPEPIAEDCIVCTIDSALAPVVEGTPDA